ncbi:MAG: putative lipid II flippase FtsW [Granulosicoccus sp.]|nr:putative lipid II flippase FtsW [Granulosicoccus sp.]
MSTLISRVATNRAATDTPVIEARSTTRLADHALLVCVLSLGLFGTAMIASASMAFAEETYNSPFYFVKRQLIFLCFGFVAGLIIYRVPLSVWERYGPHFIIASMVCLCLVLVPGIGKEVNGSRRWIDLGFFTIQVSEAVKLFLVVYLAGYLVRRGHLVQTTFGGFVRPLVLICIASALLLMEPDFGAAVVIALTAMLMLFVAGVRFSQFALLTLVLGSSACLLIFISDYRLRRFVSFLDPFSDPFDTGFQLTQSLIAIGSGGLTGLGYGNSVQKLFYLPEAHTDFLFAVLCEELGLLGAFGLILIYAYVVWRCFYLFKLADAQNSRFAGFVALGIGIWIGLQSFINMGVNLGILPTKGITLPLMSYGGSSAVVFAVAFGMLLRVEWELKQNVLISLRASKETRTGGLS